jgi:hypothetical protein
MARYQAGGTPGPGAQTGGLDPLRDFLQFLAEPVLDLGHLWSSPTATASAASPRDNVERTALGPICSVAAISATSLQ